MIKNFIANGFSFTQTPADCPNWTMFVHRSLPGSVEYTNLARSGAGNDYIADSTIRYLLENRPDPSSTLVMIMWSGVSRIDLQVSQEFYDMLLDWNSKTEISGVNYLFSGGMGSAWPSIPRSLFENIYMAMDHKSLARRSLSRMVELKNFLENHGYNYKFMSYLNYWQYKEDYYSGNLDFSVSYHAQGDALLDSLGQHWIWVNDEKDGLFEFAQERRLLGDDNFHPTSQGHELFFNNVLKSHIQGLLS